MIPFNLTGLTLWSVRLTLFRVSLGWFVRNYFLINILMYAGGVGVGGADVVLLHGCPQSCMPNPVEGLIEVYENMLEVLLALEIFLTEDS